MFIVYLLINKFVCTFICRPIKQVLHEEVSNTLGFENEIYFIYFRYNRQQPKTYVKSIFFKRDLMLQHTLPRYEFDFEAANKNFLELYMVF